MSKCQKCKVELTMKNYASTCGFSEYCFNCEKAIIREEFPKSKKPLIK